MITTDITNQIIVDGQLLKNKQTIEENHMANSRRKGQRTCQKAMRFALSFPGTTTIPIYQVSRFAQPQPFDLLLLRPDCLARLVEVRTDLWRVAAPQTRALSRLPGMVVKQIWRFKRGATIPDIRQWSGSAWIYQDHPWEGE